MVEKKGGARASKFLKTVSQGSRTSGSQERPEKGVGEGRTDAAATSDSTNGSAKAETHERRTERTSGGGDGKQGARRRSRPEKPVRITVDLDVDRHRFLRDYAHRQEAKGTAVIRALLDELRDDAELSERVSARLLNQETA